MHPELKQVIEGTDILLADMLESHELRLARMLKTVEQKVINLSKRLSTQPDGTIKGPHWTVSQAQAVHKDMLAVFEETYNTGVKSILREYDDVAKRIIDEFGLLDVSAEFRPADIKFMDALKAQTFSQFEQLGLATQNRIAQSLYNAVGAGWDFATLTDHIRAAVRGHVDIRGRSLAMYAKTYAQDALMEFYSTFHKRTADQIGLKHFLYAGNIVGDSRPFCITRAGKVFTEKQIERWEKMDWTGKKPGSIWMVRGGYNCRHHFLAVDPDWIPEGKIEIQKWKKK